MKLTPKDYYKIEEDLKKRTLFHGKTSTTVTKKDWKDAKKIIKADFKQIVGTEEYDALKPMIDEFCFSVLDKDGPYESTLASCRRLSKSTKYIILVFILIIRLPWYNAAFTVKYQNRIAKSIIPSFKATLVIMRESGWISVNEYTYLMSKVTNTQFTFDGRTVVFASAESPDGALSIQATTDAHGFIGIFVHQIDDELIIENFGSSDQVNISDEEQMRSLESITESINRNLKAPFGRSFQRVRLFNTWDFTHKYFNEVIEQTIPASDRYKNKEKLAEASANRSYLIDEDQDTDGILIREFVNEGNRKIKVGRISYKAVPEHRFDVDDYMATKLTDYNRWLPIYGAVPGKQINVDFTYPINSKNMPTIDVVQWHNVSNIMIGLDRGKRDRTALVTVVKYNNDRRWYVIGGVELHEMQNELKFSKRSIHLYLKELLIPRIKLLSGTMIINCDYHAYDFISSVNELMEEDQDTSLRWINGKQQPLYIIEPVRMSGFWNLIGNRVDLFNDKFLEKLIVPLTVKLTSCPEEVTGIDIIEKFEAVKDNPNTGERDERNKKNDLDLVNAFEYAVTEDIS